eukprot:COSAG01_NODE_66065_length_271_cov_0.889535_1_plen_50_part_01
MLYGGSTQARAGPRSACCWGWSSVIACQSVGREIAGIHCLFLFAGGWEAE